MIIYDADRRVWQSVVRTCWHAGQSIAYVAVLKGISLVRTDCGYLSLRRKGDRHHGEMTSAGDPVPVRMSAACGGAAPTDRRSLLASEHRCRLSRLYRFAPLYPRQWNDNRWTGNNAKSWSWIESLWPLNGTTRTGQRTPIVVKVIFKSPLRDKSASVTPGLCRAWSWIIIMLSPDYLATDGFIFVRPESGTHQCIKTERLIHLA